MLQLMEKVRNYHSLQSAEKDTLLCKLKLEDILSTLMQEKQQYDKMQIQKIKGYQKEIGQKNQLIIQLVKQLKYYKDRLQESKMLSQSYQEIIARLKRSFFKKFAAACTTSDSQVFALLPQRTLSRVKSDLHIRAFKSQEKISPFASSFKKMRIDINSYFLSLKQLKLDKEYTTSFEQKKSNITQHTDTQMGSSDSQNCKEKGRLKDLISQDIKGYQNSKVTNGLQVNESTCNLKPSWAEQYKQKDWKSTQ